MISKSSLYNVVVAMAPLYAAMCLGYGAVRSRAFSPEQCVGINHFVALFAMPLLIFRMIATNDPYAMNLRFIAADAIQKVAVLAALAAWARFRASGGGSSSSLSWVVTLFSLATLPNTIIMGVPILRGMYGAASSSLMVQIVVFQFVLWFVLVVFLFEYMAARRRIIEKQQAAAAVVVLVDDEGQNAVAAATAAVVVPVPDGIEINGVSNGEAKVPPSARQILPMADEDDQGQNAAAAAATAAVVIPVPDGIEMNGVSNGEAMVPPSARQILPMAAKKVLRIPSVHASVLGLAWSFIAFREGIKLPAIIDDSLEIISVTATGLATFSAGTFMAQQKRFVSCGYAVATLAMAMKFLVGPAAMAAASLAVGLRGELLHIGIVQAALPLAVISFVYAKEYDVHADIMSTGVIVGTFASFPITLVYYILLG